MKAARYYGRGDIRIEEVPEPTVAPGEVGVELAFCGICGTDLHEYLDGPIFCPAAGHPHPIFGEDSPITLGHEMSGVVYALGEGVTDLSVGEHVVVEPYIVGDDVDTSEANPAYHLSKDVNFIGLAGRGGGLVVVSIWGKPAMVDMQKLVLKEIDLRGTIAYVNNHPATIKLVQEGKVDLKPFITAKIGLDELVSKGFDTLINHNDTAVKVLVDPRL